MLSKLCILPLVQLILSVDVLAMITNMLPSFKGDMMSGTGKQPSSEALLIKTHTCVTLAVELLHCC